MKTANIITLIRILMVPVFMAVYLLEIPYHEIIALAIFIIASATDKLDGYIARKYNQISNFGKFIDPLADKLLITAALVMLVGSGVISSWAVILILAREFMVTAFRTVAVSQGRVIAASNWGKAKMVVQVVAISFLLTSLRNTMLGPVTAGDVMVCIMTAVTVWSGIDYIIVNRDVFSVAK
jgi:CDP-diacylglycerol--glycerol-3-phosphate 3-phosphatidyltransferase